MTERLARSASGGETSLNVVRNVVWAKANSDTSLQEAQAGAAWGKDEEEARVWERWSLWFCCRLQQWRGLLWFRL